MTAPTKDLIDGMKYPDLEILAGIVADRMRQLRASGLEQLHDELETKAQDLGYSLAELIAIAKKKKRKSRAHKDNGAAAQAE